MIFGANDSRFSQKVWRDRDATIGGTKYLHVNRRYSDAAVQAGIDAVATKYHASEKPTVEQYKDGEAWRITPLGNAEGERQWSWQSLITATLAEIDF